MGWGWTAVGVRELEGLENDENWRVETRFRSPLHHHTFRDKSSASSLFASNCHVPCQTTGYLLHFGASLIHSFIIQGATHCVRHNPLPHIPQGSISPSAIAFSVPLTIILVFPIFAFDPLPFIALLHLWNLALKSSKFSLISVQKCNLIIIILLQHLSSQHQPQ